MVLKQIFAALVHHYSTDDLLIAKLWDEIEKSYCRRNRYYHNLGHLETLVRELDKYREQINDWHSVLFSVFYHDIIYNVTRKDNEEKSARLAVQRLGEIHFPKEQIGVCRQQILATGTHAESDDSDTNLFTDADLAILGYEHADYENYCSQIRKEYLLYPDFVYNAGRKKVISHFLQMERIYKTKEFFTQYETPARQNLQWELEQLS